jgi:hypothetical protein
VADYLVTVRNVRRGDFGAEPGPTRFLKVPGNRKPKPDHAVKRAGVAPRAGRRGLPGKHPDKAVNINCGAHFDENYGSEDNGHSWYFEDKVFLADLVATLSGDTDRQVIAQRRLDARGRLHLT